MWYLGKHNGSKPNYTHSSLSMERFSKTNTPPYMKRRILSYGTDEEMIQLEHRLLEKVVHRDDYYNKTVSWPPIPLKGKDSVLYIHGKCVGYRFWSKEKKKEYGQNFYKANREEYLKKAKEYNSQPEVKKRKKIYSKEYGIKNRDKIIANKKEYNGRPEVKKRQAEWEKAYRARGGRDNKQEIHRIWREKNKEHLREYSKRPEVVERRRKNQNASYQRRKEEIQKRKRERYKNDPEYRKRQLANQKKTRDKKRVEKNNSVKAQQHDFF